MTNAVLIFKLDLESIYVINEIQEVYVSYALDMERELS